MELLDRWRRRAETALRRGQGGVKVSVIVAVYNPGEHMADLVRSLEQQSMKSAEFEAIFVDDGSTDGTGARLDELARTHQNFVVRHIPNSGWPGKPRNIGLDLAQGEYVAFVDHDDYLGQRALELVYEFATRHDSDIVVAREVGVGRNIGRFVFRNTIADADLADDPVMQLMTPHKVYRRSLLDENQIRFPEGKVRLEDHLFNVKAFFAAQRVSIYAGYPYYFWTRREGVAHASSQRPDLHEYFDVAMNRVLDVVDQHTEPGPYRDKIKSYWLGKKMVPYLNGNSILTAPGERQSEMFSVIRKLALNRFTYETVSFLELPARVRAHLLLGGELKSLVALAEAEPGARAPITTRRAWWEGDEAVLHLVMELNYRDGSPIEFRRAGDRVLWQPPVELPPGTVPDAALDVTEDLAKSCVHVLVKLRDAIDDRSMRADGGIELVPSGHPDRWKVVFDGRARLPLENLRSLSAGHGDFVIDLSAEFEALGWRSIRRIPAAESQEGQEDQESVSGQGARSASFYSTRLGNLSIRVR